MEPLQPRPVEHIPLIGDSLEEAIHNFKPREIIIDRELARLSDSHKAALQKVLELDEVREILKQSFTGIVMAALGKYLKWIPFKGKIIAYVFAFCYEKLDDVFGWLAEKVRNLREKS